jgi:signal transduction histidine kinase
VTLAQRLLIAIGILTIATTAALAFGVREALRVAEEERFQTQFESAVTGLESELGDEIRNLPVLLAPLCDHDPVLDAALVDLKSGQLDAGERLSISLRVPELAKALRLDELVLLTSHGEILGSGPESARVGERDRKLADELRGDPHQAKVRTVGGAPAIEAHCVRSSGTVSLGLYGARRLESILERVGGREGLTLSLGAPANRADVLTRTVTLPILRGTTVTATRPLDSLREALHRLDVTIFVVGSATFFAALLFAGLLSRGLARPIVSLSAQARRVVTGEPVFVVGKGGRELEEFAAAFNQTIRDLVALRKRLAATERIAARREIARRVAHEIKNPLAPIRAAVETLRRLRARNDPAFDEYFDEATRTVLDEVNRITNIVQEFTRFARLPAPHPKPMDLEQAVRDVVRLHESAEAPIVVVVAARTGPLNADRDQVVQVLTNLVQNAQDAVGAVAHPSITVSVGPAEGAPERVRLAVSDNGPGVSAEMRERLFEPYATTKEHGTGLGLAIVERIVIEHGGEIAYRDVPGGGAEFSILLPIAGPPFLAEGPREGPESSDDPRGARKS